MRILRWRLKLAEYEYDVVYKAGKTNVNVDALSRNPVNFEETTCKVINNSKLFNPNNPADVEAISKMLEESDEEEEDEDFELYLSDDEQIEKLLPNLPNENTDSIPFTPEELSESPSIQIEERALIHDPPKYHKMQTRSQTTKNKNVHEEKPPDQFDRTK